MTQPQARSSQVGRLVGGLISIMSLLVIGLIGLAFLEARPSGGAKPQPSTDDRGGHAPGTLLTGSVTDARGPVAGMQVRVALWPAEDDAEVGEEVDLFSVTPARTDDEGRYAVVLPLEDVPSKYLMMRRVVNLDVWLGDAGVAPLSTSVRYSEAAGWWVDVFDERDAGPKTLDFDLDSMTATERTDGVPETWPLVEWR